VITTHAGAAECAFDATVDRGKDASPLPERVIAAKELAESRFVELNNLLDSRDLILRDYASGGKPTRHNQRRYVEKRERG